MRLYFIRHGQSENNALWNGSGYDSARKPDPELTDTGRRQAECLAQFLGDGSDSSRRADDNFGITHLYCSLMLRAASTGAIISETLGAPLVAWTEVHEVGGIVGEDAETGERFGLPGHNRAYFERRFPALVLPDSLDEAGWWNRPCEQPDERLPRAGQVLEALRARHGGTDDRVALVSHGGFYNYLFAALLGSAAPDGFWVALGNCGLSRFDFFEDGAVGMMYSNRADYLPPELLTW